MHYRFFIAIAFLSSFFFSNGVAHAQSCDSLKTIFENSDFCDGKWISLHGKVYEILDAQTLQNSQYAYAFQFTDDGINIIRAVSKDKLFLYKDDEVIINGDYHKKLYADGLNLDNTIVASGKNITVTLTGEEYTDLFVNYIGKGILQNESLQKRNITLVILVPLFSIGSFIFGYYFYRRWQRKKGRDFEKYAKKLFSQSEWIIEQENKFEKLSRWVESKNNPDYVFRNKRTNKRLAVECKYITKQRERIWWAKESQIEYYQNFSDKEKIPVFVIIGIGGRPKNPKRLFLVPLHLIKYPDIKLDYLGKFERDPCKNFVANDFI